jgi:hypothetical protein
MTRKRRILVLGNSHTRALAPDEVERDILEVRWIKTRYDARFGDTSVAEAAELARNLQAQDCLVIMYFGTIHNIVGLLNHETPFTLVTAEDCDDVRTGAATLIPLNAMRAYLSDMIAADQTVRTLAEAAQCRVLHPMPPPPKETPAAPTPDKAYRGRSIEDVGFSPAPRRRALWRLERDVLEAQLAKLGVELLDPPSDAMDQRGFLKPDYHASDVTHANKRYGRLVLDQIRAALDMPAQGAR